MPDTEIFPARVPAPSRTLHAGRSLVRPALLAALLVCAAGCAPQDAPHFGWDTTIPGKTIAQRMCSDCHGLDGNPVSPQFPRLAGQQKAYLVKQLSEFQTEHRWDPTGSAYMWGIAHQLTPKQMDEIAAYYSAQTAAPGPAGDATLERDGKMLYLAGNTDKAIPACASCHGVTALGAGEVPRLADQWSHYVREQLDVFTTDQRPAGVAMHTIVVKLTPRDKLALATYLQSIRPK